MDQNTTQWTVYYPPDSRLLGYVNDDNHNNFPTIYQRLFGGTFFSESIVIHTLTISDRFERDIVLKIRVWSHYAINVDTIKKPPIKRYPVQIVTMHRTDDDAPANLFIPRGGYKLTKTISHTDAADTVMNALQLLVEKDYGLGTKHNEIMNMCVERFSTLTFFDRPYWSFFD